MIMEIVGLLGHGKTLIMSILGKYYIIKSLENGQLSANYYLTNANKVNALDLIKFELKNTCLCLDEAYTLLDARNSMSKLNQMLSYFFLQSRKRHVHILLTAQLGGLVDVRVRGIADYVLYCQKMKDGFDYTLLSGHLDVSNFFLPFKKAERFYNIYNTEEIITPLNVDSQIDIKDITSIYEDSPTRKSFTRLVYKKYPFLIIDDIHASFDFLKKGKIKRVKEILSIKDSVNSLEIS